MDPVPRPPSPHVLALALLPAVYVLITGILYGLAPVTQGWALWQRTLLVTPIMVVAMVYAVTPMVQGSLRRISS
jgi:antibiotic biosynthesis monooxygenase (ABM) superfamily enzyme